MWFVFISACLAPLPQFIHRLRTHTLPANAGLLEVVFGLLGLVLLWRVGRRLLLCLRAGSSLVEVSPQPATPCSPLEYRIVLGRPGTATVFRHQARLRRGTVVAAEVPLSPSVADGSRWRIAGTLLLPPLPVKWDLGLSPRFSWEITVKMTFGNGAVLEESHPLRVES